MDKIFSLIGGCFTLLFIIGISIRGNLNPVYAIASVTSVAVISLCIFKFLQADNERNDFKLSMESALLTYNRALNNALQNNKEETKNEVNGILGDFKVDVDKKLNERITQFFLDGNNEELFRCFFFNYFLITLDKAEETYKKIIGYSVTQDPCLSQRTKDLLREKEIISGYQLCKMNKEDFKNLGFNDKEVEDITKELFLFQFDEPKDDVDGIVFLHDLYCAFHRDHSFREVNIPNYNAMVAAKNRLLQKYGSEENLHRLGEVLGVCSLICLKDLKPGMRLYRHLLYHWNHVYDIVEKSPKDIRNIPGIGKSSMKKIETFMQENGLSWEMKDARLIYELYKAGMFSANENSNHSNS